MTQQKEIMHATQQVQQSNTIL